MKNNLKITPINLKLLIVILFLSIFTGIYSQSNFERLYYMGLQNIGHSIVETSDNNFLFTSGGYTAGNDHSYLLKIDLFGNIVWFRDYPNTQFASGKWVKETKDNKYALLIEESYYDPLSFSFKKINTSGGTNWSIKYPSPHTAPYYTYSSSHFEQAFDSSYTAIGTKSTGGSDKCYVLNLSKTGVFNWYREIIDTVDLLGVYIKETCDSCYIVLANHRTGNSAELIKLNSTGDVLWNTTIYNFNGNTILIDNNNDFLLGGTSLTTLNKSTPVFSKYSSVGDSVWNVVYPNFTSKNIISHSVIMHSSNRYSVAVRSEKSITNQYFGVVFHTDSLLNIISTDTVNFTKPNNCNWSLTISNISSGGYCLVGTIDSTASLAPRTFVKVSYDQFNSIPFPEFSTDNIKVYPNPNGGVFQISYNLNNNQKARIEIYDISGKILLKKEFKTQENTINVDCSALLNGVYPYNIIIDNQLAKADRIVIIK